MAEAGRDNDLFTDNKPLGVEDIEEGSNNAHIIGIERNNLTYRPLLEKTENDGDNDGHVTYIDNWASSIEGVLVDVPLYMCMPGHPGRISRIPENLREVDRKAYEPHFLSIGPYHHGKPRLQHMEKRKRFVLKCVLKSRPEITLKDYLIEIRRIESAARSFYSNVEMKSEQFVQMLLLDSMFILPLFCGLPQSQETMDQTNARTKSHLDTEDTYISGNKINGGVDANNDKYKMCLHTSANEETETLSEDNKMPRWFWSLFPHDLFLIENQLPFFVLENIYPLAYGCPETQLIGIMKVKIGSILSSYTNQDPEKVIPPNCEVHHLLHLCHMFFHTSSHQPDTSALHLSESAQAQMFRLGSAVQLYKDGVCFEARSNSTKHCLLDISFSTCGKMVMPYLHVEENTASLFRNLIALEQMKYPSLGLDVSAYVVLLLHLVTVPEDVELLRKKGIIQHHLASDKEMMHLINRLSVGLAFDYVEDMYNLKPVFHELKRYSERRVPRWKALLTHKYLRNPWTVISLLAAALLLLLTAVQTYYTVCYWHSCFGVHRPLH